MSHGLLGELGVKMPHCLVGELGVKFIKNTVCSEVL